jgi:serine/threonine protein kinase
MLNQTRYNAITIIQSSITEQSAIVDCPNQADRTAILQSYSIDQADELLASNKNQIDKLITVRHPHIQTVIDVFIEDETLHLVKGAVQGKPVATQVPLTEERCEKLLKEILPALGYLHEQGITHGNISPHSILLDKQNKPIITDFQAVTEMIITAGGDIPPSISTQLQEISVANIPDGQQFDLYSLGVTAIYLLSNRELKHLYDSSTQQWQWETYIRPNSGKLLRAINKLLSKQPTSAMEVLQELQTQSRVITDVPIASQDFDVNPSSIFSPTQAYPTNLSNQTTSGFQQVNPEVTYTSPSSNSSAPPTATKQNSPILLITGVGLVAGLMMFVGISIGSNNSKVITIASTTSSSGSSQSASESSSNTLGLSTDAAARLVGQWMEAKKSLFGPSYIKSAGEGLATGLAYERNITANPGDESSSIDDLSREGAYYTYSNQQVHEIESMQAINSTEVVIVAVVSEQRTLHRGGNTRNTSSNRARSCYQLKNVDNTWKISKTPELFNSCP